ncbi:calcium-binding protein [Novosphingobium sp. KCTC 2891]|nr:calcium-binding protein [Novosphingobium sp. KCTC 2891]
MLTGRAVYKLGKNVENLTFTGSTAHFGSGNALANTITGAGGADNLHGGGGDDTLLGGGGADLLYGGIGNDLLDGGTGADLMLGGKGNDTYVVDSARDRVLESRDRGTDLVKTSISYALGSNVENLELTGSRAINGTGNKLANALVGNEAKNTLSGGRGDDVLDGKGGADRLVGGLGADHFVFSTDPAGGNLDVVADFSSAQGDHVVLDRSVFTAFDGRGSVSASAFVAGDGVHPADKAAQHLIYDSTSGALYYDQDGAGGTRAVQIATLTDAPALTAADFLLIG